MQNLNSSILLNMPLLIPERSVQREIAEECMQTEAETFRLTKQIDQQIDLLAERRQALITAAVTGQLDVTTAQSGVH